jgi:hypothetical protein
MEFAEDKAGLFESLIEKTEAFGKTTYELFKLKAVDKVAGGLSSAVSQVVAFLLLFMFLTIASVGIALWLGDVLGKTYYGFFCVAGLYAICGIALVVIKNNFIKRKVSDAIIEHALD